jgi:RNA polymerase sigma-70 factor (ECF subfamily)
MTPIPELEQAYLANRARLLRFLVARGAGDAAEDLLQELWLRLAAGPDPRAACEPAYMMRAADRLMIDRYRSEKQAALREKAWVEAQPGLAANGADAPDSERELAARQQVVLVQQALDEMGPRAAAMFRRHRIDGLPQRVIAEEFGVSRGTVENDLRRVYARIAEIRRAIDEE